MHAEPGYGESGSKTDSKTNREEIDMRHVRWLSPWKDSLDKPSIYHCVSRVVERRFAFGVEEKEKFRTLLRMMENFSGCRVLSYCLMCYHIHILLEVPPLAEGSLSDAELLKRTGTLWEQRFKSVIVESGSAVRMIAD